MYLKFLLRTQTGGMYMIVTPSSYSERVVGTLEVRHQEHITFVRLLMYIKQMSLECLKIGHGRFTPNYTFIIMIHSRSNNWRRYFNPYTLKLSSNSQEIKNIFNINHSNFRSFMFLLKSVGYAVKQLFQALSYKPEGRGFDARWGIYHWLNPSGLTTALGSTQPLTEMSTRDILWG